MRVLITGSSGMLGKDVFQHLAKKGFEVFGVDLVKSDLLPEVSQYVGDVTKKEFILPLLNTISPDVIIHCAAIVNLNFCEKKPALAYLLHSETTRFFSSYNPEKTKLIYISTDSVFDGEKGNYTETDTPNPVNYYAKSKLEGENAAQLNPNHIIIRTNIFGFNIPLKSSLAEWAIKKLEAKNSIHGFTDVIFNAIYTKHLSEIIGSLIKKDFRGLINIASKNAISKYEFLVKIAKALNISTELVKKSNSTTIHFDVPRPLNTYLNIQKLESLFPVPTIETGIINMIKDFRIKKINNNENN